MRHWLHALKADEKISEDMILFFLLHAFGISIFHRDGQEGSAADEYPCA
jgi:hypothetical protein